MSSQHQTLKQMLIEDLVPGFVNELILGMEPIYPDSYAAMMQDPNLGDEQAKTALGHFRRARAETLLYRAAGNHGLKPIDVQPKNGGCSHVGFTAGRFELVMCHVTSRDAFPKHSIDREQSAQVNQCLSQLSLLNEPVMPLRGEFFGIITHTEIAGRKDQFGSIKIGFPNHQFDGWVEEPICLQEIRDIQSRMFQKEIDLQAQIQNPKPAWKTKESEVPAQNQERK